ncbi:hypothetical protein Celaphus_00004432 [Cervus elaphus hippelaphus]|uniref:Uncharacterized protein n=1 Tax=Cervus elaphus hippelaphus TaxID=46360 RepID=A0A212DDD3_CEREH|nr:hypothetical protein Celaphus_00004432 [Cervus elaphus hippelaphus]
MQRRGSTLLLLLVLPALLVLLLGAEAAHLAGGLGEWACGYRGDPRAGVSTRDSARGLSPAPTSFPHSHRGSPGTQALQGGGKGGSGPSSS